MCMKHSHKHRFVAFLLILLPSSCEARSKHQNWSRQLTYYATKRSCEIAKMIKASNFCYRKRPWHRLLSTTAKGQQQQSFPGSAIRLGYGGTAPSSSLSSSSSSAERMNAYRKRCQHTQLTAVMGGSEINYQHREVMRDLILSLQHHQQAAALSFPQQEQSHKQQLGGSSIFKAPLYSDNDEDLPSLQSFSEIEDMTEKNHVEDLHVEEVEEDIATTTITSESPSTRTSNGVDKNRISKTQQRKLNIALKKAIANQDSKTSLRLFETAVNQNALVSLRSAIDLFYLVSDTDPVTSYYVLQYCDAHPQNHTKAPKPHMYRRLCKSFEHLRTFDSHVELTCQFMEELIEKLDTMDMEVKKQAYPKLVSSLAEQRNGPVGLYARGVYNDMMANEHEYETVITGGWLKKLLMLSKYNRQDDVPFEDVLARLVEMGELPHPFQAMQAVHNMFPYTDPHQMTIALQSLSTLLKRTAGSNGVWTHYLMDMATLESISASAAHHGSPEMIQYVWEIMGLSGCVPNETIYENTVVTFAASEDGLLEAFTVLAEMKSEGFEISRPLIRSFSRAIRSYKPQIENALQILIEHDATLFNLESLNVVVSSFAERGDVKDVLHVLEVMRRYGLKPDADSYSFALEVLGKNMARHKGSHGVWIRRAIDTADSLLTKMEEHEIDVTSDVIRNYVELLCIAGEIHTATAIADDCFSRERRDLVNNKTLYRLSTANADVGDMETARRLASMTSEVIPILYRKLNNKEIRLRRVGEEKVFVEK